MKFIKYFFEFTIIISIFCIFKIIGLRNASNLGSILGKWAGPFFRSRNLISKNIKIGLGDIDKNQEKKIAAIGIKVKKWITYHGFSININNSTSNYKKFPNLDTPATPEKILLALNQMKE